VLQEPNRLGVHLLDLADEADIHLFAVREPVQPPARAEQPRVLPGEPDRLAAVVVDQTHDRLVDLAHQDHLDDLDGLLVGHAHAHHKRYLDRSWSRVMSLRRPHTEPASIVSSLPGISGALNEISSSSRSMIV